MAKKEKKVRIAKDPKQPIRADDDTIALYAYLLFGQQAKVKAEQRALGALAAQAKQNGVTWPAIKDAMKEYEKPQDVRRAKAEEAARIYAAIGVPAQLEMFEAYEPKVNDDDAAAERKGRFAAICHGEEASPYPPGSAEGQAWIRGYRAVMSLVAQHNNRMGSGLPADPTPAERKQSDDDDWDDKPVATVEKLGGVDYDPDKGSAPAT